MLDRQAVCASHTRRAQLVTELGAIAFGLLELTAKRLDALWQLLRTHVEGLGELRQQVAVSTHQLVRRLADDHVDSALPRADAGLGHDDGGPDVGGVLHVCATPQPAGPGAAAY